MNGLVTTEILARLLNNVGIYLGGRGLDLQLACELHEQALAMYQRLYEGDHPALVDSLVNLANDLRALGEHRRAQELDQQALAIYQRLAAQQAAGQS